MLSSRSWRVRGLCFGLARRSIVRVAVAPLAAALVLTACTGAPHQSTGTGKGSEVQVAVSAGSSSSLHLDGLTLQVPKKATVGSGTLSGAVVQAPAPAPGGMRLAGPVYRLEITGTRLAGDALLTVPVPPLTGTGVTAGPDVALLAYYDTASGKWVPVSARYDPERHTLTAATPHLSLWTALRVDAGKLLSGASSLLKGFLDISGTTSQPSCPGHGDLASAGITTASDKGDLVKWCAGVAGGQPLLRVADNRHYAMEADYPVTWQANLQGEADPKAEEIVRDVAQALSPAANGGKSVIIPGGGSEQFTVPSGAAGEVAVRPSSEAYLIDALLYGADTLAMTMDDIPGAPPVSLTETERAIKLALDSKGCVTQADVLLETKVTSASAVGKLFRADAEWAVGCLGKEWKVAYGLSGFVGSFVVKVLLWLVSGIRLVVDGLRAAIDSVIYWRNYRIVIGQAGLATFRGQWHVHDGTLCVGSALHLPTGNGAPACSGTGNSGWMRGWFGCNVLPPATVPVCNEWDELTFTADSDGTITGTITNVFFTTDNNVVINGFDPGPGYDRPGDTFRLAHVATGLLRETILRTHLSQSDLQYGNPYWCGPGISAANQPKCGA